MTNSHICMRIFLLSVINDFEVLCIVKTFGWRTTDGIPRSSQDLPLLRYWKPTSYILKLFSITFELQNCLQLYCLRCENKASEKWFLFCLSNIGFGLNTESKFWFSSISAFVGPDHKRKSCWNHLSLSKGHLSVVLIDSIITVFRKLRIRVPSPVKWHSSWNLLHGAL